MTSKPKMYIYHLPYEERRRVCFILDQDNKWEVLGLKLMGFDEIDIDNVKKAVIRGNSPSCELLTMWGQQNQTVLGLFILLNHMKLYQAMSILRPFVEDKYHVLIKKGKKNSSVPSCILEHNTIKTIMSSKDNKNIETVKKPTTHLEKNFMSNTPNSPKMQRDCIRTLRSCIASSAGATPQIPYEDLELATDTWHSSRILGQGGFGTVYRGTWKYTEVAIKHLEIKENTRKDFVEQIRQSVTELHCLNAYRHDNVLPLYGFSIGGPHPCLVYQYMPGGSLDSRIRTRNQQKVLSWPTRLKIAIGTARGLQFLHTTLHCNKPLIHGDIKSANILLDLMDQPKIGDFGLAREGPEGIYTHIEVSRVHGTFPYVPQELLLSKESSTKVDTYSFGVVLFELATARPPASKNKLLLKDQVVNHPMENILQLKDPNAEGGESIFKELIRIGKTCVEKRARDRPEMVRVLLMLEEVQEGESKSGSSTGHSCKST